MTKERNRKNLRPQVISRREFVKLTAMAGLLAGCRSADKLATPTGTPAAMSTTAPTTAPTATPTPAPTATPTTAPAATPMPAPTAAPPLPRPEIIKFYPDIPSKVIHARHASVWENDTLAPEPIRHMLDGSIMALTGLDDATEAWAALFAPGERIAIKVNTIQASDYWTRVPLVMAVTECLQEAGVLAEQITIFDRRTDELEYAGFAVNKDGPGVRCYGTDSKYTKDWTVMERQVGLSDILLNCDALINMPILKHHNHSGVTFAMKNHFGTFNRPAAFHRPHTGPAIVELNTLAPIRDRTRLVIGDALTICPLSKGGWHQAVTGDSILVSFDPVAHDTVGLHMLCEAKISEEQDPTVAMDLANTWLTQSAELGLGANNPDNMELVEVILG